MALRTRSWLWVCSAVWSLACANDRTEKASNPEASGSAGSAGSSGGVATAMSSGGSGSGATPSSGFAGTGGSGGSGGPVGSGGNTPSGGAGGTSTDPVRDAGLPDAAPPVDASTCYSPGQNLEHVRAPGAVGCPCADPGATACKATGKYLGAGGSPVNPVPIGLVCERGRWKAVEGGPCNVCWTPETPELAEATGFKNGCACSPDRTQICVHTGMGEYVECRDGRYVDVGIAERSCPCSVDAHCGYGGKCVEQQCSFTTCVAYGVRYAPGVSGIPDPFSCNTCSCNKDGTLSCTEKNCP